jgi:hypothetical protein
LACRNPKRAIGPLILLLEQAFTACSRSFLHVSLSLYSVSPAPGPEANVCLNFRCHSQQSCHVYLLIRFCSSSQIGKVRQLSPSICPNAASPSTTRANRYPLVLLPWRVHDAALRSPLNPSIGGPPLFPNFYACINADPFIPGYRFIQCGRRRKRSVSFTASRT